MKAGIPLLYYEAICFLHNAVQPMGGTAKETVILPGTYATILVALVTIILYVVDLKYEVDVKKSLMAKRAKNMTNDLK